METQRISHPDGGSATISLRAHFLPSFEFDAASATFGRDGNNLTIDFNDGGRLVISNFFVAAEGSGLPQIQFADGTLVDMGEFLTAQNPDLDITTAAGPHVDSCGVNEYQSDPGALIGGVDRFGSLGTDYWARSTEVAEIALSPVVGDMPGPIAPPITPPVTPPVTPPITPPVTPPFNPLDYVARGVIYPVQDGNPPELHVDLLRVNGNSADKASSSGKLPGSVSLAFYDADGNEIDNPFGQAVYDPRTGQITFTNPPTGGIYYCTITDSSGNRYSMQLVVDLDGTFNSHDQDAATPPAGQGLVYGEWHAGQDESRGTSYDVVSSDLSDTLTFTGTVAGGKINTGLGNDVMSISAVGNSVYGSDIEMGAGNDTLTISTSGDTQAVGVWDSSIAMGAGADSLDIQTRADNGSAYGVYGASIDMGRGDDNINITTEASGYAYGMAGSSEIRTGAGNDRLNISTTGGYAYVYGVSGSRIDMGDGADSLNINTRADYGAYGVSGSSIDMGSDAGNDTISIVADGGILAWGVADSSNILTGAGDDSISITAAAAASDAFGLADDSRIDMGAGADRLSIESRSGNGNAYGLIGNARIDMGDGADSLSIMSKAENGYACGVYGSSIDMGSDESNDTLNITVSGAQATGLYNSGIDMGAGNDSLTITANASTDSAYGVSGNSRISMGNGNDRLNISSMGGYGAYGVNGSSIDMGVDAGNDSIHIFASGGIAAWAVAGGSEILTGAGDDSISITAAGAEGNAYAVSGDSSIRMGAGNDALNIIVTAGESAYGLNGSLDRETIVDMGDGRNTLNIEATGGTHAIGAYFSTIITGNDDDNLSIHVNKTSTEATGLTSGVNSSDIFMGAGNDSLSITAESAAYAYGVSGSWRNGHANIDMGTGNDQLNIDVTAATYAHGVNYANINMGEGNDSLNINVASDRGNAYGVSDGSEILMGDGNDLLSINASSNSGAAYSVYNAIIDMGSGDDVLMLTNGSLSGATLLGGSNNTVIQASGNGDLAHLGDILGLGGDIGHSLASGNNSIFTSGNNISGFESLLLDLTDGNADTVNIDELLNTVRDLYGAGKDMQSLIIRGDQMDSVDMGSAQLMGESVRIEGQNGYYDYYQARDADGDLVNLYIQQTITG